MQQLRWVVAPQDFAAQQNFTDHLGLHPLVGQLLLNRGIKCLHDAEEFLSPSFSHLHPPSKISGMDVAVPRIVKAIKSRERIAIYGDYDVDGVTSTATLYHALNHFGIAPRMYIPHRRNEGYGINPTAIRRLAGEGISLIISVDCGITAVEPAEVATQLGVDLIITDHHMWKEQLPVCHSIVHPRLGDYPNKELCGAGVAFKLAWAIGQAMAGSERCEASYGHLLMDLLAFTALGTIADVVPLIGENRAIAVHGLQAIPESRFIGMQALISSARIRDSVDGYQVGFTLAPRLNAAGRMGHAEEALKMFTWANPQEAADIAQELERKNKWRQETQRKIVDEAKAQAEQYAGDSALIVVGHGWHPGVVGIVASRLIDDHYCPTIVLTDHDGKIHGSARSIEGFDLAAGLKHCEKLFTRWGGHAMAAGLELPADKLDEFRAMLNEYVKTNCPPELLQRKLDIDAEVDLDDLTTNLVYDMKKMGPFGTANRRPLFAIRGAAVVESKVMGEGGKHLMLRVTQGNSRIKAVMWNQGHRVEKLGAGTIVDLAGEPEINSWQGRESVELLCRDLIVT